jgi:hypothetical protein
LNASTALEIIPVAAERDFLARGDRELVADEVFRAEDDLLAFFVEPPLDEVRAVVFELDARDFVVFETDFEAEDFELAGFELEDLDEDDVDFLADEPVDFFDEDPDAARFEPPDFDPLLEADLLDDPFEPPLAERDDDDLLEEDFFGVGICVPSVEWL